MNKGFYVYNTLFLQICNITHLNSMQLECNKRNS